MVVVGDSNTEVTCGQLAGTLRAPRGSGGGPTLKGRCGVSSLRQRGAILSLGGGIFFCRLARGEGAFFPDTRENVSVGGKDLLSCG